MPKRIHLDLGKRSYNIYIDAGILRSAGAYIKRISPNRDALIITNRKIYALYGKKLERSLKNAGMDHRAFTVPDTEKSKSLKQVERLNAAITRAFTARYPAVLALGGGVIGDLAGFVASVCKRGLPLIQIPTTLLAQLDSSIGGKVGVDTPRGKNLIGAFYQPRAVLIDTSTLKTLSRRQLRCGLAEAVKYAVIADRPLFRFLRTGHKKLLSGDIDGLKYVISRCARIKASVVERDEFDRLGLRAILNYGHTIGHAIEAAGSYGRYLHGEAVSLGMLCAADIAVDMGLFKPAERTMLEELVGDAELPGRIKGIKAHSILSSLRYDKKFSKGRNLFILPVSIGKVKVVRSVPEKLIKKAIAKRTD